MHIMTFDIGTSSLKAALIDQSGKVVAEGGTSYTVSHPKPGWAEQDPEEIWNHICATSQDVISQSAVSANEISAVVFVAPWKNIIALDDQGKVLRDSIIWMDARAAEQAERLNQSVGKFVGSGQEYWPRLMWMKEQEPELWHRARHIIGLNTYFKFRATGEFYTEPSDDFIRSANPELNDYYQTILKAADLLTDTEKFPVAKDATEIVGNLTETAAQQLGIASGTPVIGGFGDLVAITWGAGKAQLSDAHLYFGTSSWLVSIIKNRSELEAPLYFSINQDKEGAVYALQTGCLALDWVIDQVYRTERSVLGPDIYRFIGNEVSQISPGSDGVIATHWLTGELAPLSKNAKGSFFNLTTNHDRRHMVRAMMESVCFTHRRNISTLQERSNTQLSHIRVVGGGAVSDVWMQMLADILNISVQVPESPRYSGTLGAYYCAAQGLGWLNNADAMGSEVNIGKVFTPNPVHREIYDRNYRVYMKIHPALKEIYNELNGEY